jgi:hypothetical protein
MSKILLFLFSFVCIAESGINKAFFDSFINSYEFNTSGRYAHEYHQFILEETAKSLSVLEDSFDDAKISVKGRFVIMGYEGNAIPSYFTSLKDCEGAKIDDEYVSKLPKGWSLQLHNQFGLMTGFLFRDVNKINCLPGAPEFLHTNPHSVELFHDRMEVFRQDSFGSLNKLISDAEHDVVTSVSSGKWRVLFDKLISFWQTIYSTEGKTGDTQVAGTQDILFTLENAKFLRNSSIPLLSFYTGGDITYPILVSKTCGSQATINAQDFVKQFSEKLKPENDEPTLFVFKSFVDGVGKSTLVGNVCNYLKFGDTVESYESVDNTSSLVADVFPVVKDVFVADLPAQVSHFTHKPDGSVYVSLDAVGSAYGDAKQIEDNFNNNKKCLISEYGKLIKKASKESFEASSFPEIWAKNLVKLKRENRNSWVPYRANGRDYLIDINNTSRVSVLLPLGEARSEGLKNVEPEQMLFLKGLTFPPKYELFIDDLIGKAKDNGIKHVVFVDFLSMYPRSSRENVRLNYLLQRLSEFEPGFDPYKTLYRNFSSNCELLALIMRKSGRESVKRALVDESVIRFGLHKMMSNGFREERVTAFSDEKISAYLKSFNESITAEEREQICDLVERKVECESSHLKKVYASTKEFVNVYTFSPELLLELSIEIEDLLSKKIENREIKELWSGFGTDVLVDGVDCPEGKIDQVVQVKHGSPMRAIYKISPETKNKVVLDQFFNLVRRSWYAAVSNIPGGKSLGGGVIEVERQSVTALPVVARLGTDGMIYLLQRIPDFVKDEEIGIDSKRVSMFEAPKKVGIINEFTYYMEPLDLKIPDGLLSFGMDVSASWKFPYFKCLMADVVQKHQYDNGNDESLWATNAYDEFSNQMKRYYSWLQRRINDKTKRRDVEEEKDKETKPEETPENDDSNDDAKKLKEAEKELFYCEDEQRESLAIFARTIATIEMVVKDVKGEIAVRPGNREDFYAAVKLVEEVMFPQYFGLVLEEPLFNNSNDCTPIVPWSTIDSLGMGDFFG